MPDGSATASSRNGKNAATPSVGRVCQYPDGRGSVPRRSGGPAAAADSNVGTRTRNPAARNRRRRSSRSRSARAGLGARAWTLTPTRQSSCSRAATLRRTSSALSTSRASSAGRAPGPPDPLASSAEATAWARSSTSRARSAGIRCTCIRSSAGIDGGSSRPRKPNGTSDGSWGRRSGASTTRSRLNHVGPSSGSEGRRRVIRSPRTAATVGPGATGGSPRRPAPAPGTPPRARRPSGRRSNPPRAGPTPPPLAIPHAGPRLLRSRSGRDRSRRRGTRGRPPGRGSRAAGPRERRPAGRRSPPPPPRPSAARARDPIGPWDGPSRRTPGVPPDPPEGVRQPLPREAFRRHPQSSEVLDDDGDPAFQPIGRPRVPPDPDREQDPAFPPTLAEKVDHLGVAGPGAGGARGGLGRELERTARHRLGGHDEVQPPVDRPKKVAEPLEERPRLLRGKERDRRPRRLQDGHQGAVLEGRRRSEGWGGPGGRPSPGPGSPPPLVRDELPGPFVGSLPARMVCGQEEPSPQERDPPDRGQERGGDRPYGRVRRELQGLPDRGERAEAHPSVERRRQGDGRGAHRSRRVIHGRPPSGDRPGGAAGSPGPPGGTGPSAPAGPPRPTGYGGAAGPPHAPGARWRTGVRRPGTPPRRRRGLRPPRPPGRPARARGTRSRGEGSSACSGRRPRGLAAWRWRGSPPPTGIPRP